ncbi:MAG: lipoate---protein ligase [Actinomycetota bacterium]
MRITHWAGAAAALHARPVTVANPLNELHAARAAVVLGRAQKVDDGFADRAAAHGLHVARRVSGGTAVLVGPGECAWIDVVVGRDAPGWNDDIGKAGCWMGDQWVAALGEAGVGGTTVHRTAMQKRPGSDAVCFAGVGPGEVLTADGAKVVGISQRRTRAWALFQCAIPLRWDPAPLIAALGPSAEPATDAHVGVVSADVARAAVSALARILG